MTENQQFGRYRILRTLGQGAMGTVYLAEDMPLGRRVALKIPRLGDGEGSTRLERFYREARLAATLRHPHICPIHDVGECEGTHFISMAYIEGKPLADALRPDRLLTERQAASVVRKIALALQEAHAHGVVHRDLKPANVMIDRRGEPMVMDFGLARQMGGVNQVQLTGSGALLGTPSYMSPEQVAGDMDAVGPSSDIYSLGVILYQSLTNELPFRGSVASVLAQIATQHPERPATHRPGLSAELEAICLRAMARDPAERFASMAEFAMALGNFLRRSRSGAGAAGPPNSEPGSAILVSETAESQSDPTISAGSPGRLAASWSSLSPTFRAGVAVALVAAGVAVAATIFREATDKTSDDRQMAGHSVGLLSEQRDSPPNDSPDSDDASTPADDDPAVREAAGLDGPSLPDEAERAAIASVEDPAVVPEFSTSEPSDADFDEAELATEQPTLDGAVSDANSPVTEAESQPVASSEPEEPPPAGGVKPPARKAPPDLFPAGSVWKGKLRHWVRGDKTPHDGDFSLTVTARNKGTFDLQVESGDGNQVYQVSGSLRGSMIEWTTEKANVLRGTVGRHRWQGKITKGERLELRCVGQNVIGKPTIAVGTAHRQ